MQCTRGGVLWVGEKGNLAAQDSRVIELFDTFSTGEAPFSFELSHMKSEILTDIQRDAPLACGVASLRAPAKQKVKSDFTIFSIRRVASLRAPK